ncbi:hypothetical protein T12_4134 [Trichinella patagoniensis]|uniref:Uncharacterized protein n=1 Tax=Trichinella patagoniensis TaxID=990121 RepID=A0A0V0ZT90_9BILA|nr:hypothetical protein T12_4134 [Trichinella patagoniensis]
MPKEVCTKDGLCDSCDDEFPFHRARKAQLWDIRGVELTAPSSIIWHHADFGTGIHKETHSVAPLLHEEKAAHPSRAVRFPGTGRENGICGRVYRISDGSSILAMYAVSRGLNSGLWGWESGGRRLNVCLRIGTAPQGLQSVPLASEPCRRLLF